MGGNGGGGRHCCEGLWVRIVLGQQVQYRRCDAVDGRCDADGSDALSRPLYMKRVSLFDYTGHLDLPQAAPPPGYRRA